MKTLLTFLLLTLTIGVSNAQIISTVAGNGTSGYIGDGGSAVLAELNNAVATVTDTFGNLFISDSQNHVVRKVVDIPRKQTPLLRVKVTPHFEVPFLV